MGKGRTVAAEILIKTPSKIQGKEAGYNIGLDKYSYLPEFFLVESGSK